MVLLMVWHYLRVIVLSSVESVCAAGVGMLVDDVVSFSLYLCVSLTLPPLCS